VEGRDADFPPEEVVDSAASAGGSWDDGEVEVEGEGEGGSATYAM
jgi:hypothetical protein